MVPVGNFLALALFVDNAARGITTLSSTVFASEIEALQLLDLNVNKCFHV